MANVVKVDATHEAQKVHSVTVFQIDRAEVNRRIHVQLKKGQNEVEISKLPSVLDNDSIRVDGLGPNAIIFDVIYHPPPPATSTAKAHDAALAELNTRRSKIGEEQAILRFQASSLTDYAKKLSPQYGVDAEKLEAFLDSYQKRQMAINGKLRDCAEQLVEVDKLIKAEKASLHADEDGLKRAVRITVVVLAEEDGDAELSLSYVVSKASWTPQYDVRAAITQLASSDSTSKPASPTVSLHYRASISQSTGEDWAGTALTLSTASPQIGSAIPSLSPYWISESYRTAFYRAAKSKSTGPSFQGFAAAAPLPVLSSVQDELDDTVMAMRANIDKVLERGERLDSLAPKFLKMAEATATEGAVSATFKIEGSSNIPSNTTDASQTHKVSVAVIDLTAELEWIAVPRELPSAFLQARIKNTSEYLLLPGPANIFMDNNFVSKSEIPHVSPAESFSCSLGVDPQLKVTYHPLQKKTKAWGTILIGTKTLSQAFMQRITVKNTRRGQVRKLIIRDQIPVTTASRIKVTLAEPALLSAGAGTTRVGTNPNRHIMVTKNVVARWVPKDDDASEADAASSGGAGDGSGEGLFEWVCTGVDAGQTVDVNLSWDVSAPQGVSWGRR